MKAVISADELAKDVAGAEALLESHQEHKVYRKLIKWNAAVCKGFLLQGEIDAREDSFNQTAVSGQGLLDMAIPESDEVVFCSLVIYMYVLMFIDLFSSHTDNKKYALG